MKKRYLHFCCVCLSLLLFTGCEWEVDLEEYKKPPRLVLNSVAIAGEPVTASLSRSWFFTDDNPNITFADAEVHLYVNGEYREAMSWREGDAGYNSRGFYEADYMPQAGDRIALTARKEGFPEVSTEAVIPSPCPALSASEKITQLAGEEGYGYAAQRMLTITFRDDPAEKNYYLCQIERGASKWDEETGEFINEYDWWASDFEFSEEPLFAGQQSALEKILGYDWLSGKYGRVFNDDMVDGKEYSINLPFYGSVYTINCIYDLENDSVKKITSPYPTSIRVSFYTITEGYYRYLKTLIDMEDDTLKKQLIHAGLAEPVSFYCNIKNGLGVLGACNRTVVTLELSKEGVMSDE